MKYYDKTMYEIEEKIKTASIDENIFIISPTI